MISERFVVIKSKKQIQIFDKCKHCRLSESVNEICQFDNAIDKTHNNNDL